MKIALFSDLHLNHWRKLSVDETMTMLAERCAGADVVINAGDTSEANIHYDIKAWFPRQKYLEIPGNHDYYKGTFQNKFYTTDIDGYRFFIGTLWTNFNENPLAETVALRGINDFRLIKGCNIETMKKAYAETVDAINQYRPDIVVTHFAPFHRSIHPKFTGNVLNHFFCNDMVPTLMDNPQIQLWLHGHTHAPMDYNIGNEYGIHNCRVVANPLGYPGELMFKFEDYYPKMIEV